MKKHSFLVAALAGIAVFAAAAGVRAAEPARPTVRIGYLPILHSVALMVADQQNKGAYKNLDLELVKFSAWPELLDAYASGQIQGASELLVLTLAAAEKGIPVSILSLSHRHGDGLTVANDIASVKDLAGKRVAIPHRMSVHNLLLAQLLKKNGLGLKDVEWVELPPPDMPAALARGDIKGYIVAEPFGARAAVAGSGKLLVNAKEIWPDYICCGIVLNPAFVKEHPAAAQELVTSVVKAGAFVDANRAEGIRIARQYLNADDKVLEQAFGVGVSFSDLKPGREALAKLYGLAQEEKLLKGTAKIDDLLDTNFVDAAYAK